MKSQKEKAEDFRALHHGKKILILPNGWDVPSARAFEDAGFPAIATSSAGLLVSLGYPDGEVIGRDEFVSAVGRIARALSVPLSADVVAGFGKTTKDVLVTVRAILKSGAVGINLEDFTHATKKLYPIERQVENVKAIRKLGETTGIPLVINARTDALRFAEGDEGARFKEAVRRATKALDFPTNDMVRKGLPPISELERLGVARVSFGPTPSYAAMGLLKRAAKEVLEKGTYENLIEGAITFDELNALAVPRAR